MAKYRPRGNSNNAFSWRHIFTGDTQAKMTAKLSRSGASDLYKEKEGVIGALGKSSYDKIVKARYDWLFDDLQQFTSTGAENINSKEDLRAFVEETIGQSKGFQSMKEKNRRRYDSSISRATEGLWRKGHVDRVASSNVVQTVTPERAKYYSDTLKPKSRERFLQASYSKDLYRIRREQFVILNKDKRGRFYFSDVKTGRRVPHPQKVLAELGLE